MRCDQLVKVLLYALPFISSEPVDIQHAIDMV
eukprot:CAMPEP_0113250350 /NCGR_PEP_ID=MMETSP0008_2-20120614/11533_1 /TAXON_ID=97485 /ORGANISM="Prymnesium parvum" /LENGTH=31 /DNA_ID=CAMNT_0000098319 /DNA_START=137 /DNA_END=232 /DNA_ORIENTATION=- /assembly_acc=CAM_ASM_000153